MEEKKTNKSLKIVIAVMAIIILALAGVVTAFLLKDKDSNANNGGTSIAQQATEAATTAVTTTTAATQPPTEATTTVATTTTHISPKETVNFTIGSELSEIDAILNYNNDKTYKACLGDFVRPGSKIDSFIFVFYSEDGQSNIRNYKGGCGISVNDKCEAATDEGWYQSDDFETSVNSAYLELKWEVPGEIRDYINISQDGFIEIGYWWGGVKSLRLSSIICNYSATAEIPVDGTKTTELGKTLKYSNEDEKTAKIPLADLIEKGTVPQYFEFKIKGNGELQKYSGAFGISVDDSCPDKTGKGWYQSGNVAVMTSSDNCTLYWLVPDEIKNYINTDGEVMLGYWWSKQDGITLESITAKYSIGSGIAESEAADADAEVPKEDNKDKDKNEDKDKDKDKDASEGSDAKSTADIVKEIKVGWNLGNTLDCYDVGSDPTKAETGWGNPKTTKKMIDTVKAAGFNAVRIPVTWNDHMNGDTINDDWMNRVNEVVDYAIDNGMYVILNVHHDDYTWLNPTYADEEKVKARLVKIWEQISARFKDYDYHLIFEGMNEPRVIGGKNEWTCGTEENRAVISNLFAAFVDTVRKSGGNNATRTLLITGNAAAMDETNLKSIKIPDDDRIAVSIHYYSPWEFAGNENSRSDWGSDADKKELDKGFDLAKKYFIDKGVPVLITEFGSTHKGNEETRAKHMEYYVKAAKQRGIPCFVWDNGIKDEFGLLDRKNNSWWYKSIVDAAVNAAK